MFGLKQSPSTILKATQMQQLEQMERLQMRHIMTATVKPEGVIILMALEITSQVGMLM